MMTRSAPPRPLQVPPPHGATMSPLVGVGRLTVWLPCVCVQFVVDRPFLFVIENGETGEVLFMGQIASPQFTGLNLSKEEL